MAFSTQKKFLRLDSIERREKRGKLEGYDAGMKRYLSCLDGRAWSLDPNERNLYLAELIACSKDGCSKNCIPDCLCHINRDKNYRRLNPIKQNHIHADGATSSRSVCHKSIMDILQSNTSKRFSTRQSIRKSETGSGRDDVCSMVSEKFETLQRTKSLKGDDKVSFIGAKDTYSSGVNLFRQDDKRGYAKEKEREKEDEKTSHSLEDVTAVSCGGRAGPRIDIFDKTNLLLADDQEAQAEKSVDNEVSFDFRRPTVLHGNLVGIVGDTDDCESRRARVRSLIKQKGEETVSEMKRLLKNYQDKVTYFTELCKSQKDKLERGDILDGDLNCCARRPQDKYPSHRSVLLKKPVVQFSGANIKVKGNCSQRAAPKPMSFKHKNTPLQAVPVSYVASDTDQRSVSDSSVSATHPDRNHPNADLFLHHPDSLFSYHRVKKAMEAIEDQTSISEIVDHYSKKIDGAVRKLSQIVEEFANLKEIVQDMLRPRRPSSESQRSEDEPGSSNRVRPNRKLPQNIGYRRASYARDFLSIDGNLERIEAGVDKGNCHSNQCKTKHRDQQLLKDCQKILVDIQKLFLTEKNEIENIDDYMMQSVRILKMYRETIRTLGKRNKIVLHKSQQSRENLLDIMDDTEETRVTGFAKYSSKEATLNKSTPSSISLLCYDLGVDLHIDRLNFDSFPAEGMMTEIIDARMERLKSDLETVSDQTMYKTMELNSKFEPKKRIEQEITLVEKEVLTLCRKIRALEHRALRVKTVVCGKTKTIYNPFDQFCSKKTMKQIKALQMNFMKIHESAVRKRCLLKAAIEAKDRVMKQNDALKKDIDHAREIVQDFEDHIQQFKSTICAEVYQPKEAVSGSKQSLSSPYSSGYRKPAKVVRPTSSKFTSNVTMDQLGSDYSKPKGTCRHRKSPEGILCNCTSNIPSDVYDKQSERTSRDFLRTSEIEVEVFSTTHSPIEDAPSMTVIKPSADSYSVISSSTQVSKILSLVQQKSTHSLIRPKLSSKLPGTTAKSGDTSGKVKDIGKKTSFDSKLSNPFTEYLSSDKSDEYRKSDMQSRIHKTHKRPTNFVDHEPVKSDTSAKKSAQRTVSAHTERSTEISESTEQRRNSSGVRKETSKEDFIDKISSIKEAIRKDRQTSGRTEEKQKKIYETDKSKLYSDVDEESRPASDISVSEKSKSVKIEERSSGRVTSIKRKGTVGSIHKPNKRKEDYPEEDITRQDLEKTYQSSSVDIISEKPVEISFSVQPSSMAAENLESMTSIKRRKSAKASNSAPTAKPTEPGLVGIFQEIGETKKPKVIRETRVPPGMDDVHVEIVPEADIISMHASFKATHYEQDAATVKPDNEVPDDDEKPSKDGKAFEKSQDLEVQLMKLDTKSPTNDESSAEGHEGEKPQSEQKQTVHRGFETSSDVLEKLLKSRDDDKDLSTKHEIPEAVQDNLKTNSDRLVNLTSEPNVETSITKTVPSKDKEVTSFQGDLEVTLIKPDTDGEKVRKIEDPQSAQKQAIDESFKTISDQPFNFEKLLTKISSNNKGILITSEGQQMEETILDSSEKSSDLLGDVSSKPESMCTSGAKPPAKDPEVSGTFLDIRSSYEKQDIGGPVVEEPYTESHEIPKIANPKLQETIAMQDHPEEHEHIADSNTISKEIFHKNFQPISDRPIDTLDMSTSKGIGDDVVISEGHEQTEDSNDVTKEVFHESTKPVSDQSASNLPTADQPTVVLKKPKPDCPSDDPVLPEGHEQTIKSTGIKKETLDRPTIVPEKPESLSDYVVLPVGHGQTVDSGDTLKQSFHESSKPASDQPAVELEKPKPEGPTDDVVIPGGNEPTMDSSGAPKKNIAESSIPTSDQTTVVMEKSKPERPSDDIIPGGNEQTVDPLGVTKEIFTESSKPNSDQTTVLVEKRRPEGSSDGVILGGNEKGVDSSGATKAIFVESFKPTSEQTTIIMEKPNRERPTDDVAISGGKEQTVDSTGVRKDMFAESSKLASDQTTVVMENAKPKPPSDATDLPKLIEQIVDLSGITREVVSESSKATSDQLAVALEKPKLKQPTGDVYIDVSEKNEQTLDTSIVSKQIIRESLKKNSEQPADRYRKSKSGLGGNKLDGMEDTKQTVDKTISKTDSQEPTGVHKKLKAELSSDDGESRDIIDKNPKNKLEKSALESSKFVSKHLTMGAEFPSSGNEETSKTSVSLKLVQNTSKIILEHASTRTTRPESLTSGDKGTPKTAVSKKPVQDSPKIISKRPSVATMKPDLQSPGDEENQAENQTEKKIVISKKTNNKSLADSKPSGSGKFPSQVGPSNEQKVEAGGYSSSTLHLDNDSVEMPRLQEKLCMEFENQINDLTSEIEALQKAFNEKEDFRVKWQNCLRELNACRKQLADSQSFSGLNKERNINSCLHQQLLKCQAELNYYRHLVKDSQNSSVAVPQRPCVEHDQLRQIIGQTYTMQYLRQLHSLVRDLLLQLRLLTDKSLALTDRRSSDRSIDEESIRRIICKISKFMRHHEPKNDSSDARECVCAFKTRLEKVCAKILQKGIDKLKWDDLAYLHSSVYKAGCAMQGYAMCGHREVCRGDIPRRAEKSGIAVPLKKMMNLENEVTEVNDLILMLKQE